jgi:hypothetical protein
MLKKHSRFFDPSVELLTKEGAHFLTMLGALELEEKLVSRFIFQASFVDYYDKRDGGHNDEFEGEMTALIEEASERNVKGKLTKEDVSDIFKASKSCHRLETLFTLPWEKGVARITRYRQLTLTLSFFVKSSKKPFYKVTFIFGDEEKAKVVNLITEKIA